MIDKQYLGQVLLERGFRDWFLYMFRILEKTKFIIEPIHDDLFKAFQDVYDGSVSRKAINIPPRAGKTSLAKYFVAYCLAKNPKCNFIYTSYSQSLLNDISRSLLDIIKSVEYSSMYDLSVEEDDVELPAIDVFWRELQLKNTKNKKATYSSKRWTTPAGGVCLFASVGASITGFGAGIRGYDGFSGALIIDDANKPADIHSEVMRKKVIMYYQETLLSRLNNSRTPIINIQQRLHLEDLTGFLIENYDFDILVRPLISPDGVLQLPSQYDEARLKEIKMHEGTFLAQYQQQPIVGDGNLFKVKWFDEVEVIPSSYDFTFITADTAYKEKQQSDFTVFTLWGKRDNNLYRMDSRRKKISAVDIESWIEPWIRSKMGANFRYVWIEPQGHGIYLNQAFKKKGIPIPYEDDLNEFMSRSGKQSEKRKGAGDKVTRANNIIPSVDRVNKNVIFYRGCPDHEDFISELVSFPNGKHDDSVDTFIDGMNIGFNNTLRDWSKVVDL